jgi:hypothetical protein
LTGKYRIVHSEFAQHSGDLLGMNEAPVRAPLREVVKTLARLAVMIARVNAWNSDEDCS